MRRINILLLFFVTVLMSGCLGRPETEVSPDRIWPLFNLTYIAEEERTYASAIFLADGETGFRQQLPGSASVFFNEAELRINESEDQYLIFFTELILEGEFNYTDLNDDKYVNPVSLNSISFPSGLDTIDPTQNLEIRWIGDPVGENESVIVFIEDQDFGINDSYIVDDVGAQTLFIPNQSLAVFGFGPKKMTIIREWITDTVEDPGIGGQLQSDYFGLPLSVNFE